MEKLIGILSPPETPHNPGDNQGWGDFISTLGTELPSDYKKFIETYGTGGIDNFIWILTPFVYDENVNYLKRKQDISDAYLQSKQYFPEYYKHDIFPVTGGLLPWAFTDNGDEVYWLTMTQFFYRILSKDLTCDAFPDDLPSENPIFKSVIVD